MGIHSIRIFVACVVLVSLTQVAEGRGKKKGVAAEIEEVKLEDVALPVDQEVCFSPDEPCDKKLVRFVDTAQKSVDVAIYDINLDQLVEHLIAKAKIVTVRVVVDQRQSKGGHSRVGDLVAAGVQVKYGRQRGIMHDKFVIVDGKMVETGSFNFTNHASKANQENQIYLTGEKVVERYVKRFDRIWDGAKAIE